ncbi:MAG: MFS transporter [Thalassolituus sp.]|uniref:MFS transporter n=1 Tax=Thalassolituus TaxID=187492 RepID=UPI001B6915C8|nr:MFS transporter [Thalassolituus oleivorans]MBQ0726020.1 MFS transporter [Thalassolituus oleivorans]MBQ0782000.1 MFS transporter [Thalassolituus oleivorans]MCA6126725.1 MFS transporter [Thalassolituus oleivorans 4BN06-13]MDF1640901.1 MFS transporter [Thalassolituus oleivorans]
MLQLIAPIGSLLTGVSLLLLGSGLLNTLLAIRGGAAGYDSSTMGLIMSGYFVGFFVGTFIALPMIRRVGHIRVFALCAAVASVSVMLHQLIINPWVWVGLRVLTGISLVILYTVIESWLNAQTPANQRGKVFAVYMVVNLAALTLAQQLMRFDSAESYILFALASMLVTLSLVPVAWTRLTPPEVQTVKRLRIPFLWRIAPVAVAASLFSGLAMGAFWGMGAVYAGKVGLDDAGIASFMSAGILGGALLQYPLGRYSDSSDRRKVIAITCALAAAAALLLIPAGLNSTTLLLAIALYGGLAFAIYPVAVAHLIDHLDGPDIIAGGSAVLLLHGVGAAIGPALAGQLMTATGPNALPVYFCLMQLLLASFAIWKINARNEDEYEHPAQFVAMVRTTPTALEMYPDESEAVSEVDDSLSSQARENAA